MAVRSIHYNKHDSIIGFKLLRERADGSLGPLFIDRKLVVKEGQWLKAKAVRTKGFAFRPGFHACTQPKADHLSKKGRVWCKVELRGIKQYERPKSQGGIWYTAKEMKVLGRL